MSGQVDLERLAQAITEFDSAFLITVSADDRIHTVTVEPTLAGDKIHVDAVGRRTIANVQAHSAVSLAWSPREPGGYALMVDGCAAPSGEGLDVVPTKALLHRRAEPGSRAATTGCLHDCVVFEK